MAASRTPTPWAEDASPTATMSATSAASTVLDIPRKSHPTGKTYMAAQTLDFSDDLVQLKVDAVHATFNVHRKVLSASSKFFQAALKREWASSRSDPKIIDLSDDGYTIVHAYLHWLYTQQFITCIGGMLISAYIFGEKVMDIKYKNAVLQKIMAERIPTRSIAWAANKIYGGSPPSPPARRLMADMVADLAQKGDEWNFVFERLNNKVLVDAMKVMVEVRRAPNTRSWMVSKVKCLEEDHEPQASV